MATLKKILEIALSQEGYHEKNDDTDLDSFVSPTDGDGNHTKYARDLWNAGHFNGDKCGYEWCTIFVNAVFLYAGLTSAEIRKALCQDGSLGAGCVYARQYYKAHKRLYKTPKVGDQVFFSNVVDDPDHTGLVIEVGSSGAFMTIEGNWGNKVTKVAHNYKSDPYWSLCEFGRPYYDEAVEEDTTPVVEPVVEPSKGVITYTVQPGDTLWDIGQKYGVDYHEIAEQNGISDPSLISVGQVLTIGGTAPAEVKSDNGLAVGDMVKVDRYAPVYGCVYQFDPWVYDALMFVRDLDGDRAIISSVKEGPITGPVDKKYLTKS